MTPTPETFRSPTDDLDLHFYRWDPDVEPARGVVQIAHGLAEHGARYDRLARRLTEAGYIVYAHDHRGHGASTGQDVVHGAFGAAGWPGLLTDLVAFTDLLKARHPDLPLYLVAHSMGSFATQEVLLDHARPYAGVVLSGSTALDALAQSLAEAPADAPAGLEAFNAAFEHRTGYEWLSRDEAEVDAYVADPWCGFDVADDTLPQLLSGAAHTADPDALAALPNDLPLLIVSGDADPLAGPEGALIELLAQRYREAGLTNLTVRLYPQARHEIFNEINRDDITDEVLAWLHDRS